MSSPVKRKLASLSEPFRTTIYSALIRFLIRMNALMLFSILVESKLLVTISAREPFLLSVDQVVSSKAEFSGKSIVTMVTLINSCGFHFVVKY